MRASSTNQSSTVPRYDGTGRMPWTSWPVGHDRESWIRELGALMRRAEKGGRTKQAELFGAWRDDLLARRPVKKNRTGKDVA